MSEAANLLNSLSAGMGNAESHIIINPDRTIFVPEELREIAVQYDHNIETVTFDCPRYWDDIDMSVMQVCINYMRADGKPGCYVATDVTVDRYEPGSMHFTWTLSRNVTEIKGSLKFLICVKKTDTDGNLVNHWSSKLNTQMSVSEGMECGESIVEEYPDVITQILTKYDALYSDVKTIENTYGKTLYFFTKAERDEWMASRINKMTLHSGDILMVGEAGVPVCVWDNSREVLIELGGGGTGGSVDLSNYYTKNEVNGLTLLPGTNLYDKSLVIDGFILANTPNAINLLQAYANGILSGYVEVDTGSTYTVTNGAEDSGKQLYVGAVFFFDNNKKPVCAIGITGSTHGSWPSIEGNAIVSGDGMTKTITILNPSIKYIMWYVTTSSETDVDARNFYGAHDGTDTIVNHIQMNKGSELLEFTEYGLSDPIKNTVLANSREIEELKKNKSDNTSVYLVKSDKTVQFRSDFGENDICIRAVLNGSKNNSFNISGYYTVPKDTELSDITSGTAFKNAGDDITPLYFVSSYIGANHAIARVYKATFASSHGLTEANIGETWNLSTDKSCMILQVPSDTEIVIGKPKNDATGLEGINASTITSLTKDGVTINPSNASVTQLWPGENHISVQVFNDKWDEITENGVYNGAKFNVVESYDIPYIPSVTAHLAANIGSNTNNSVADDSIMDKYCTVNIIYTFTERGAVTVYQTVDFDKTLSSVRAGFVQSGSIGQYFAVPGTTHNILSKQTGAVDLNADSWDDSEYPPDRFYQFKNETQTSGMCIGYCPEYGDAVPSVRKNQANAGRYETSFKMYPYVRYEGAVDNTTSITAISYRTPLNQYDPDIPAVSWYYVGDDIYLLIDVQKSVNKYLDLPTSMNGRKAEVLKSFGNFTLAHPFVGANGIKIVVDTYGSAVIKLTK